MSASIKYHKIIKPLKLEQKLGFNNSAVLGGLERYMPHQLREIISGSPGDGPEEIYGLIEAFQNYSELNPGRRSRLVRDTLALVSKLSEGEKEPIRMGEKADPARNDNRGRAPEPEVPVLQAKNGSPDFIVLQYPLKYIKGVGPKRVKILKRMGIENLMDLLLYLPRDYKDRSQIKKIAQVRPGEEVTVRGRVVDIQDFTARSGTKILKVFINDGTGVLAGVWFNQPFLKKTFSRGETYSFSGRIQDKSWYRYHRMEMANPIYEREESEGIHTGRVVPIYPLTEGISQKEFRNIISNAIKTFLKKIPCGLPPALSKKLNLMPCRSALAKIHFPQNYKEIEEARKSLAIEELFLLQWGLLKKKKQWEETERGESHAGDGSLTRRFLAYLPFELTAAQKKAWAEIRHDLSRPCPMHRLLQGDVGSGKTVIACLALLKGVEAGSQGVFMAPTEILAEQHFQKLQKYFEGLKINVVLLRGRQKTSERNLTLKAIEDGTAQIVVGTHALFQEGVSYKNLGVIIIDEQHRFGVEQRLKLREKGVNGGIMPDILVMTATPIPRSLALTLYGDLSVSVIDELPPGRKPVQTFWRRPEEREKIWDFVEKQLEEGRQAYVVCPLIEESDKMELEAATKKYQEIKRRLENFQVQLIHGSMPSDEKNRIMGAFRQGQVHVLVSTTVIEVGVDVPNATVMVIEDAQRFGLAQLHQLRGRVGRGGDRSYCILIGTPTTPQAKARLETMCRTSDGFELAEVDLKLRGPGEFFGTRQHGMPELRVADLVRDTILLGRVRNEVESLLSSERLTDGVDRYLNRMFRLRFPGEAIL